MAMINWKGLINIIILVVACEFIYWSTSDLFLFNSKALNLGLEFLYYTAAAFIALILTVFLTTQFEKITALLRELILVLINTYVVTCLFHLFTTACDEQMNLNLFYSGIDVLLLAVVGYLLAFKILPKVNTASILTVTIATLILLVDSIYFLIGYRFFYPGYW